MTETRGSPGQDSDASEGRTTLSAPARIWAAVAREGNAIALLGLLVVCAVIVAFLRENAQPWQPYQRKGLRLQAEQARAALRLAGSESDRLAAQARLTAAEGAPVGIIQVIPTQSGRPEYCLTCHLGLEEISASHPVEAFGCVVCHGGDALALDEAAAHAGMRGGRNPSRLDVAAESCGQPDCHGGYPDVGPGSRNAVDKVLRTLQATYAGGIAQMRYTFGAQPNQAPRYGIQAVSATRSVTASALSGLDALPPSSQTGQPIDSRFRAACLTLGCHLWTGPRLEPYFYRGEGCSACHALYNRQGTYQGGDATLAGAGGALPIQHRLTTAIPYNTCDACHNRGNYDEVRLVYDRRDDLEPAALDLLPAQEQRYREYYQPIGQFTRCEWELDCVDCHTANQVMGTGDIYGRMKDSQTTQCLTCHGTLAALPAVAQVTEQGDPAVRQARVNGKVQVRLGDWLVVTGRGEKLPNVQRVADRFVLTRKVTGQQYTIPLVRGSKCQETLEEQESAACHACHDDSGRR